MLESNEEWRKHPKAQSDFRLANFFMLFSVGVRVSISRFVANRVVLRKTLSVRFEKKAPRCGTSHSAQMQQHLPCDIIIPIH